MGAFILTVGPMWLVADVAAPTTISGVLSSVPQLCDAHIIDRPMVSSSSCFAGQVRLLEDSERRGTRSAGGAG